VLTRPFLQVLVVGIAGFLLVIAWAIYRIAAQGQVDEARRADAIVVLGAAQFNGQPGGVFEARLQHAVDLYQQHYAPYLIVTGGKLPDDITTEAATARAWAILNGVPEEAILGEDSGRNTLESLEGVASVMRAHGLHSALVVSDRTHMLRAVRMAADLGLTAWGSPTASSPTDLEPDRRWRSIVHELAGLAAYYVGRGRAVDDPATASSP
jgi:uncharacterized SAM-binding protein YcdF (DUF218 family)